METIIVLILGSVFISTMFLFEDRWVRFQLEIKNNPNSRWGQISKVYDGKSEKDIRNNIRFMARYGCAILVIVVILSIANQNL